MSEKAGSVEKPAFFGDAGCHIVIKIATGCRTASVITKHTVKYIVLTYCFYCICVN